MASKRQKAEAQHYKLLEQLDTLTLSDSCCEICHCDCYSSHRSSDTDVRVEVSDDDELERIDAALLQLDTVERVAAQLQSKNNNRCDSNNNGHSKLKSVGRRDEESKYSDVVDTKNNQAASAATNLHHLAKPHSKLTPVSSIHNKISIADANTAISTITASDTSKNGKKNAPLTSRTTTPLNITGALPKTKTLIRKRSKSVSSCRSRTPSPKLSPSTPSGKRTSYYTRDCKILQELLNALDEHNAMSSLQVNGKNTAVKSAKSELNLSKTSQSHAAVHRQSRKAKHSRSQERSTSLSPLKLSTSMANLCLAPTVRTAYQQVPAHDKRILNRMANKRNERHLAKENAWLARKYWENERYERELFKYAQMEEYKRAVRDKQFQDYLVTKARLNEIAERDLAELQRLRDALQQKDETTKRRLNTLRVERGIAQCQRRTEELRRAEAVAVQQEEQQLDESLRKEEMCAKLAERLNRAEQARGRMLDSYLRRLRYDNYMEELVHEEHWRETQQLERLRREQLQQQIQQKCAKSQRFAEARQRRNEALAQTAKISASLRELVRSSVTPEGGVDGNVGASGTSGIANTIPLAKVLFERPEFSRLPL